MGEKDGEKAEKGGKALEKEIKKQSAKAGGMSKWLAGESTKGSPKGEAKKEIKKALEKMEKEESKAIKKAGLEGKDSKADDPNGFEVKKKAKGSKSDSVEGDGAMEMTRSGSKSSGSSSGGNSDCAKCNKNKGGGSSGGSGGSGGGGDSLYNYFKRDGRRVSTKEFGFHRSKMKNYKENRYGEHSAVASGPESADTGDWTPLWGEDTAVGDTGDDWMADDWTDFRLRRNL